MKPGKRAKLTRELAELRADDRDEITVLAAEMGLPVEYALDSFHGRALLLNRAMRRFGHEVLCAYALLLRRLTFGRLHIHPLTSTSSIQRTSARGDVTPNVAVDEQPNTREAGQDLR